MKQYSFNLDLRQTNNFFSPIREKRQIISLLMKTIKLMLINQPLQDVDHGGEIVLVVSKMSRLFYFSESKYFSISFPFSVIENDGELNFTFNGMNVDSQITSDVLSVVLKDEIFQSECAYQFIEPIIDVSDYEPNFWILILNLLTLDDGYIRYDYDEANERGDYHPRNHYDVFYSSCSTFKIGLRERLSKESLIDLVELKSQCHFIEASLNF